MEIEDVEAAIAQVDEALKSEQPFNRHEKNAYSKIAGPAFENIRKARADGFSFVQICAAYEKTGLLPRKARPHSFQQAFYREREKQKKSRELSKRVSDYAEADKKTTSLPMIPEKKKLEENPASVYEKTEQKIKEMTSYEVKTGTGNITKHSDGSFDY